MWSARGAGVKDFLPDASILQKILPDVCDLDPHGCDHILELIVGPVRLASTVFVLRWLGATAASHVGCTWV